MNRHGKIAEHNTRYSITITKDFKIRLQEQAKKENRSLNALIIDALHQYMERQK